MAPFEQVALLPLFYKFTLTVQLVRQKTLAFKIYIILNTTKTHHFMYFVR
jgi:hypothetical protein